MSARKRILIVVGFFAIMAVACNQPEPPVAVEPPVTVEPASLSPTPLECTENPPGLGVQVDSLGNRRVMVRGEGFRSGEELVLVFSAQVDTPSGHKALRHEVHPAQTVGEDGAFTWEETMQSLDGNTTWNLAVVHAQGVACVTFAAP
jgi:hypothetical protein